MIVIAAPYEGPTTYTAMPNPALGDEETIDFQVNSFITMDGDERAYLQKQGKRILKYNFVKLGQGKILEFIELIKAYPDSFMRLIDHNGVEWKVQFAEPEVAYAMSLRAGVDGYEYGDLEVQFIGVKV